MGLLDDAIREHLDLKRRRGADPAEVERAEREALGPVRRGPEEPLAMAADGEPVATYDDLDNDAGWDQLAHDAAEPHDVAEREAYDYPEPAPATGRVDFAEPPAPGEPLAPADPLPAEPPPRHAEKSVDRSAPGELEFTDEHDAPAGVEADRAPLPHQAPPGAFDEPNGSPQPSPGESHGETVEYDVEREMEAEPPEPKAGDEDVLEETPEFLQDTPDHDRLWFEQRPPKDFDFDG